MEEIPKRVQDHLNGIARKLPLGDGRLAQILELPENNLRGFKKYRTAPAIPKLEVDLLAMLHRWVAGDELEALGTTFLSEVTNADYRAEALSEFTSTVFEHHLPWALGSLVAWINEELQARGAELRVPLSIASHIHFGAATPTALKLMTGGVRSRRLAHAASAVFGPVVENLRADLQAMDLPGWRDQLGAYPSELRDLLTFVRREPQVIADVLNGGTADVELTHVLVDRSGPARLELDQDPGEPRPLRVLVDAEVVGDIPLGLYDEVRQLLDLGFDLEFSFDHEQARLSVALAPTV
ncbi:MAG: hypothetical protein JJE52_15305 [Acidimicrobiia bacterium]|nr:hypothetical protein [Acidimicrobiia bacterium]